MTTVAVIGGGPAGLMAAEAARGAGAIVTVYDRMPTLGRKFLMAGRGGLNITHTEPEARFGSRYAAAAAALAPSLSHFSPSAMRTWCAQLGEPTFAGTSGRVFPHSLKASPLLRAWLRRLADNGVGFAPRHHWAGWTETGALRFETPGGPVNCSADATVLAMGGASWPKLGADGGWRSALEEIGVTVTPLRPSNCGFVANWSPAMARFAGQPLKGVALRCGTLVARGEAMVTQAGLEGGAVYALSAPIRDIIMAQGEAMVCLALRPEMSEADVARRLAAQPAKASRATRLRKALHLSPASIALLGEAMHQGDGDTPLARLVNAVPVRLLAPTPLAEAISTAGGVSLAAMTPSFMLRARPGVFVAGEMMDWEAPTGGYLLQGCFATGLTAGREAAAWAAERGRTTTP